MREHSQRRETDVETEFSGRSAKVRRIVKPLACPYLKGVLVHLGGGVIERR